MISDRHFIDNRLILPPAWGNLRLYDYGLLAEIFIALLYFILTYYIMQQFANARIKSKLLRVHFIQGWLARVAGGLFVYIFYLLYYGSGDTHVYIRDAKTILVMLYEVPVQTISYLYTAITGEDFLNALLDQNEVYYYARYRLSYFLNYIADYNSEMVSVFTVPFMMIGLGAIYASLIVLSTFSFFSSWLIYIIFVKQYPRYARMLSLSLLYLPSLNVWTGSPFKETYALMGISLMMYGIYQALSLNKWYFFWLVPIGLWIAYVVKPYVAMAILPWSIIWVYLHLNKKINHPLYTYFFSPLLLITFFGISYVGVLSLGEKTQKYSIENIPKQAYVVYSDLKYNYTYYQETGGSVYDIGDFEPTVGGMLSKFPIALLTATYRPFLWEARKLVILMAAIETFVLLVITIFNIFNYGIVGVFRKTAEDKFLTFCMGYSIFFLFMIGLISSNFGNLVRYRLPGYIFFISGLFVIFGKLRDESHRYRWGKQRAWRSLSSRSTRVVG